MTTTENVHSFPTPDGTRLTVHWQGPHHAPLTIVLVHGWMLDLRVWGPVADLLAGPGGWRVLRYDQRGHGRSDPADPTTATINHLADDLAELLRSQISGPVVLVGHSMGGMAIMGLADRHAELVAQRVVGVAFVATSCGDLTSLDLGLRPVLARLVARGETRLMRSEGMTRRVRGREWTAHRVGLIRPGTRWLLFGEHPRRADIELTATCMAQNRLSNLVDFRPTFTDHDRAAALAAFANKPTLVLAGVRDRLTPIRHATAIAAQLPDATLVRYAGAAHMVHLERADQVAHRITELAAMGVVPPDGAAYHVPGG